MKTTTTAIAKEVSFLNTVTSCWSRAYRSGAADRDSVFRQLMAEQLCIDGGALDALFAGIDGLYSYAVSAVGDEHAIAEEEAALAASRRAVRPVFEARLQHRLARLDAEVAAVQCRECGLTAESQGFRWRTWRSSFGPIRLRRRYSHCELCGTGRAVAQERAGLGGDAHTARLAESITKLATVVPYQTAVDLTESLLGVQVSVRAAERLVAQRATHVSLETAEEAARLNPFDRRGLQRRIYRPVDAVQKAPRTAYLEMDGVFVMTREEDPTRRQPAEPGARGGKGRRYDMEGREVKNAVLYTDAACAEESDQRSCLLDKRYVSHMGHWTGFARRVWPELIRERFDQADRLVVLSDGARWIRDLCAWLPIRTQMILDLFHVKHRIWEVSRALHFDNDGEVRRWAREQIRRVEAGEAGAVVESLCFLKPSREAARVAVEELHTYLSNNLDRMDYPTYRAEGLRVGSGAVESANYHVTGGRLKLQGMRWSELGAADMALLRTDLMNGRWRERTLEMLAA